MKKAGKTLIVLVTAFAIILSGTFAFGAASAPVFADVGSVSDNEDVTYDKDGGVLSSVGIDTSVLPEDYDPNSTENPYGSDVTNLNAVNELVVFRRNDGSSRLYGHNAPLDGKYDTLVANSVNKQIPYFTDYTSASAAACDLTGSGRDSGLAIVYTNYCVTEYQKHPENNSINMILYNPYTGTCSEPIPISSFIEDQLEAPYLIQSQLQITCGDYDNDTVDEIAVYVPSVDGKQRAKVAVFDLVNGKSAQDPYSASAWQLSWNYVLPVTSEEVVSYLGVDEAGHDKTEYFTNFYNNLDLASGDADNDGTCDLVISYGASATGAEVGEGRRYDKILRSIVSQSVLLYGSDQGQMLKESQKLSYDDNDLIRVSFAFGDLDDDGNEEMILAGQLKDEQDSNVSRVLGKYTFDSSERKMIPETIQNMDVVDGTVQDDGSFATANGWDDAYYSTPVMNTNLSVGTFYGQQSNKRIYLDSVLYSYDSVFTIEDELEDKSETQDKDGNKVAKGSRALDIMYNDDLEQWEYFEYGAKAANFTGGDFAYGLTTLVSKPRKKTGEDKMWSVACILTVTGNDLDDLKLMSQRMAAQYAEETKNMPYIMAVPDTDVDGTVAEYTGNHKIVYDKPQVDAVLVSAPYFKDVAAYDNGDMLQWCSTGYGVSDGTATGHTHSKTVQAGAFVDFDWMWAHFFTTDGGGKSWSWEWGDETSREFTISYDTAGGEDAVVLYSTPREYFEYTVTGVEVDDDGNTKEFKQTMYITFPHQPVTQTLLLADYMEIQKEYSDQLPDVTQYFSSTPGDPSSYPKNENDIPKIAKENLAKDGDGNDMKYAADKFAGIAYGSGRVSQSFSVETTTSDQDDNKAVGGYGDFNAGLQGGTPEVFNLKVGAHASFEILDGTSKSTTHRDEYSCTVANMPVSAKDYGYDFSWKLFEYNVKFKNTKDNVSYSFPVVTYITDDVLSPPSLPDKIEQDFENTTDSQTALTWTYNTGTPQAFEIYKYEDFPQGGGDLPVGTVAGSNYRIKKDENGNTVKDAKGHVVHEYTFIDKDLTADTKYQYRMKVKRSKFPQESIFSPVIEARTDVSRKPDVKLTSNNLKIYPDGVYHLAAVVADPDDYEGAINYQWQKYDAKKRAWSDVSGCTKNAIAFYKCAKEDAGLYRCRVNLVRKVESHPQYISTYTDTCAVTYSKRSVKFGPISVYEGTGSSPVNTGVSVSLSNTSASSVEKPSGIVDFRIEGANAILAASVQIDEATGIAKIDSLEDGMGTQTLEAFTDGGYKVTASYQGSAIFYAADDPEEYHYLRNIDEALWLSASSSYVFGKDIMETTGLYDYKKTEDGRIERTDVTDQIKTVKFYAVGDDGKKTGDALASYTLANTDGKAFVPLNEKLAKQGCVEVFTDDSGEPAGSAVFRTEKMVTKLSLPDKMTGTGDLMEFYKAEDLILSGDGSLTEQNIVKDNTKKSLADLIRFKYYEANGDFLYDSTKVEQHKSEFIPADYTVKIDCPSPISTFYQLTLEPADYVIVGNYYKVDAVCSDPNAGVISMLSPDSKTEYEKTGYAGGTKLVFKAVPNRGYQVRRWEIDECGKNKYTKPASETLTYIVKSETTSGNGTIKITAILEPKANTLVYGAKGKGTVEVTPQIDSGSIVVPDTDLTFKATPEEGWRFEEWKWVNDGGSNSIAKGVTAEDGTNIKTFTMTDNPASVYGIFMRETIDLDLNGALNAAYLNDGSNPLEETGILINAGSGQGVPKGVQVTVSTKKGFVLAADAEWKVLVTTPEGTKEQRFEEVILGGQEACRFTLPDDVTACEVTAKTEKGTFSVNASADDVRFKVKVDGAEVEGAERSGIRAGSAVEITALPDRGKLLKNWTVNGETIENKELIYTTTITENLSVTAETKEDKSLSLKLKSEGGGIAFCVITDKNGEEHAVSVGADEITPDLFEGESLLLRAAPDEMTHTLTAVSLNGSNQALEGDVFELKEIAADTEIICRFMPSTYHHVTITDETKESDTVILDENGIELNEGESLSVPDGEDAVFRVAVNSQHGCFVYNGDTLIGEESREEIPDENITLYTYRIKKPEGETFLTVRNGKLVRIGSAAELQAFFSGLKTGLDETDAVLTADIEMPEGDNVVSSHSGTYGGTFDGNGHTIKGLGTTQSLFWRIGKNGCVKDVVMEDLFEALFETSSVGYAVIALQNYGTISGVRLKNAAIHATPYATLKPYSMAGIAVENEGAIMDCEVSGLHLQSAGEPGFSEPMGCAGVIVNQAEETGSAVMKNNYFEGLETGRNGSLVPAEKAIVADPEDGISHGTFEANYFKAKADTEDPHGISVYTLAESPEEVETPAFARFVAYTMNQARGENIWGIRSAEDTEFSQVRNGSEGCKAPVEITFVTTAKKEVLYAYPDLVHIPDESTFGDNTLVAWEYEGEAYAPGSMVLILKDAVIKGVEEEDLKKDYVASVSVLLDATPAIRYFKELAGAIRFINIHVTGASPELTVFGTCEISDGSFTIDSDTTFRLASGAKLTLKKNAEIQNEGRFVCETGSEFHKYGSIRNNGTIDVSGTFVNYGSKLTGKKDTIAHRDRIICKPHSTGEWTQADKPNADGTWTKTSACEICGKEDITEVIEPNPEGDAIRAISLFSGPDQEYYELGEAFSDKGMIVSAELVTGDKAVVTKYSLTLDEKPLENGTVLDTEGTHHVGIHYNGFTCSFDIIVQHTAELLSVTDQNGMEIRECEAETGEAVLLTASLKQKPAELYEFLWTTEDPEIASLDGTEPAKERRILAGKTGSATVTVTVVDENGVPITAIDPKTVLVNVVSHVTELQIAGGDKVLDAGDLYPLSVKALPEDFTDELTWSSADEEVAAVDSEGVVTAQKGGKTVITVTAENGVSASCKVTVYEKAGEMALDSYEKTMALNGFDVLGAKIEPATANGEITWTTGNVEIAGFYVKNKQSGSMEVVDTVTTRLSADGTEFSDAYVMIAGTGNGETVLQASAEGADGSTLTKECKVTVSENANAVRITNNGATISGKLLTLDIEGRTIRLSAESTAEEDTLTWSSIDDASAPVIRVNSVGSVSLLRPGTAAVMVRSEKTQATDVCMIRVLHLAEKITLSESRLTLVEGKQSSLTATLLPEGSEGDIRWSSSDRNVALVSENGVVTAVSEGSAVIRAKIADGVEAECQVQVEKETFTVTFTDGLGNTLNQQTVKKGESAVPPADPKRNGYQFSGWDKDFRHVNENLTVNAKWHVAPEEKKTNIGVPKVKLSATAFVYDGKIHKPKILSIGGMKLREGKDYTVKWSYPRPLNVGTYMITIYGKGDYIGATQAKFKILPMGTKIRKLVKGKKSLLVGWTKVKKKMSVSRISGYQIELSLDKQFKKHNLFYVVNGYKNTALKINKLQGGKKYYVRIRTFRTVSGLKHYSPWSKVKSGKTKK